MNISLPYLFAVIVVYLSLLFLIAYATEKGWISGKIAQHPITYVLSLGVYATSWSFYGSVGFAEKEGFLFLTIYIGVTLAFIAAPVLLAPILRLVREYQLTSLADLFAFRYRSQLAGILVTLFMLAGTLPYIALQIRAVTDSIRVLTLDATPTVLALGFCVILITFAILFGARHISPREKHAGLVVAIAFESSVKLIAMLAVGLFAVFGIFGSFGEIGNWLNHNPQALESLYRPAREGKWTTLLFLAFAAAFLLPRQFHMTFTENIRPETLGTASWAFPLYLLLFNLAIPLILWAAHSLNVSTNADYYVLGLTLFSGSAWLTILAFIGGISAASAMMIVTTLALAAMCLNHLLLPASYPDPTVDLYRRLLWGRRTIIAVIVMAGFGFYLILETSQGLVQLGLISFVAVAQFLPGIVGILYWSRANRVGFVSGLIGGSIIWTATLIFPLMETAGLFNTGADLDAYINSLGMDKWTFSTFLSLAVNTTLFILGSLLVKQSGEEAETAQVCTRGSVILPPQGKVAASSPQQFTNQLASMLGEPLARNEVQQALDDLGMSNKEGNPSDLRRLRDRIERNLSGLIGPQLARMIVNQQLQLDREAQTAIADSMRFVEERLEASRSRLRGLTAQLDTMRRYQRQVLQDLPVGVCSIGPNNDVIIWNHAMGVLSGINSSSALGVVVNRLAAPWDQLLTDFQQNPQRHVYKLNTIINGQSRWFDLHKASVDADAQIDGRGDIPNWAGMVIMVEDLTETHLLEMGLAHSERLASIGRLAAGVAHEIGNPVTGIACLAQNVMAESSDKNVHETASLILDQTKRIDSIVKSLVVFSHGGQHQDGEPEWFDIHGVFEEAIQLVQLSHSGNEINYLNHCESGIGVKGDRQKFLQVFVNIINNSCDASRPGDKIDISASQDNDKIIMEFVDFGEGIPDSYIDKVFEPFVTSKAPGKGTGLGLFLAYNIVKEHHGDIAISSEHHVGTRVTITLPKSFDKKRQKNQIAHEEVAV